MEKDLFSDASSASADDDQPNWREANAAMRADRQQQKALDKRARSGEGMLKAVDARARQKHPKDPHKQVNYIFQHGVIDAAIGRPRRVSDKRQSDLANSAHFAIDCLAGLNIHLQNASEITQKHALALVRSWQPKLTEGTIQERVSLLRRFMTMVGKPQVIPIGNEWQRLLRHNDLTAGTVGRTYVAVFAKGWRDLGHDPMEIIERVRESWPVIAGALEMMYAFGLRLNESVQIQPHESDMTEHLFVYRGTKGGKSRKVKFSAAPAKAAWQRQVLENAKVLAMSHPKRELAMRGYTLKRMKSHFHYVLKQHGLTRKGTGLTAHGLRHQFANDLFRDLSGLPAPVLKEIPHAEYGRNAAAVEEALLEVSRQLGHERKSITGAYLGSKGVLLRSEREKTAAISAWLEKLHACVEAYTARGVSDAWIIGEGAAGNPIPANGMLMVTVWFRDKPDFDSLRKRLVELSELTSAATGVSASVALHLDDDRPDDGAEINLEATP